MDGPPLLPGKKAGIIRSVRRRSAMELFTLGIDLAKTTFHLVGMNQRGEVVVRKRLSRTQLLHFTANLKVELIGMEACGGSHAFETVEVGDDLPFRGIEHDELIGIHVRDVQPTA